MTPAIHIAAIGACTPVGSCSAIATAAVRAGLSRMQMHEVPIDDEDLELRLARCAFIEDDVTDDVRMLAMLDTALGEVDTVAESAQNTTLRGVPCWLSVPDGRDDLPGDMMQRFEKALRQRRNAMTIDATHVLGHQHAGGIIAIDSACAAIQQGKTDFALVGGVEAQTCLERLTTLVRDDRVLSESQPWGYIPGEAAAFMLLCGDEALSRAGLPSLGQVLGVGVSHDAVHYDADEPATGHALTHAVRGALCGLPKGAKIAYQACTLNAERWRGTEFGFHAPRVIEHFEDPTVLQTTEFAWGDVGAASGVLLPILCVTSGLRGFTAGPYVLVWCASPGSDRAAVLLEVPRSTKVPWERCLKQRLRQARELDNMICDELFNECGRAYDQRDYQIDQLYLKGGYTELSTVEHCIRTTIDGLVCSPDYVRLLCDQVVDDPEPGTVYTALRVLWLLGEHEQADQLLRAIDCTIPKLAHAILAACKHTSGAKLSRAMVDELTTASAKKKNAAPGEEAMRYWRLGLRGEPTGVSTLIAALEDAESAPRAAEALLLMTGAELFEELYEEEVLADDALFEEELRRRKAGDATVGVYRHAFMTVSRSPHTWRAWWSLWGDGFSARQRCRVGRPCTLREQIDSLASPHFTRGLRDAIADELATQHACPVPFRTDMFVDQQQEAIEAMREWAARRAP